MRKKKVLVLLSSYNGEKYLNTQLDSILCQKNVEVFILIRDDGSLDNTTEILREYAKNDNIQIQLEKNIGCVPSFFELIEAAGLEYDYYAFSDQDDYWDDNKLNIACEYLEKYDVPAVYSSNTRLVDENLNLIKIEKHIPKCTLGSAIVKNYATGCTMVFNKKLMKFLKQGTPCGVPYHDWWVNLVAIAVGGISVHDTLAHISYRQHSNNINGGNKSVINKWSTRLNKFINKKYGRDIMASQLLEIYSNKISPELKKILYKMSKNQKMKIIFDSDIKTENHLDNILFGILVVLNRI